MAGNIQSPHDHQGRHFVHGSRTTARLPNPIFRFTQVDREFGFHLARGQVGHRGVGLVQRRHPPQTAFEGDAIGLETSLVAIEAQVAAMRKTLVQSAQRGCLNDSTRKSISRRTFGETCLRVG